MKKKLNTRRIVSSPPSKKLNMKKKVFNYTWEELTIKAVNKLLDIGNIINITNGIYNDRNPIQIKIVDVNDDNVWYTNIDDVGEVSPGKILEDFVVEITTTEIAEEVTLPLSNGYTAEFTINWGDGSNIQIVESFDDVNATHVYSDIGIYDITISGILESWETNYEAIGDKITKIKSWGNTNLKRVNFNSCDNLTTMPLDASGRLYKVEDFTSTFYHCHSLQNISNGLLDNNIIATDFVRTFAACSVLTTIPNNLFKDNISAETITHTFSGCTSLTNIPSGLFDTMILADTMYGIFYNCLSLIEIPSGLFDNNTEVVTFGHDNSAGLFQNCETLTSIPSGLFDNNLKVTSFISIFQGCDNLITIPDGLFDNNLLVTHFGQSETGAFNGCYSLTAIPDGLFDNNTAITTIDATFSGCITLTAIPAGLFDNLVPTVSFGFTFNGCSGITSAVPELWNIHTGQWTGYECYNNCINASNYASIPAGWK